jgi:hypothetical protein
MAKTNSNGEDFTILADGFSLGGGTTPRKVTVKDGDVIIAGTGTAVVTFPSATSTLQTLDLNETVTGVKTFNAGKFGLRNVLNTITSFFTNAATIARTWTIKDADGTFAFTSDIVPAGSTTQIQYNNAGAFAGSANFVWDDTTKTLSLLGIDTGIVMTGVTNEPPTPAAGTLEFYSKAIAGRMMAKIIGPSGIDTALQTALFQNRIMMYVPSTGTTGTGSGTGIGPVWTSGGTVSHPTPSSTAPAVSNQMNRTRYANVVTTTNQTLGIKAAAADSLKYWRGNATGLGGFFYTARFIVELYPASSVRIFAGLTASSGTYVVASDTVLNNTCGLWHDTTDPSTGLGAFNFVTRNGATTTKQQITLANAIAAGNSYDFYMWSAPNGSSLTWRLDDIVNGVSYTNSTSTTLPANTVFMGPQCAMSNGTANITVTTSAIGVAGVYTESDR